MHDSESSQFDKENTQNLGHVYLTEKYDPACRAYSCSGPLRYYDDSEILLAAIATVVEKQRRSFGISRLNAVMFVTYCSFFVLASSEFSVLCFEKTKQTCRRLM